MRAGKKTMHPAVPPDRHAGRKEYHDMSIPLKMIQKELPL
jgi:hypothetical protein